MNARELHQFYAAERFRARGPEGKRTDLQDVRDVLDELDRARTVDTLEGLADLKPDTVVRDHDGYVIERLPGGWYWGDAPFTPALPVRVLALPGEG